MLSNGKHKWFCVSLELHFPFRGLPLFLFPNFKKPTDSDDIPHRPVSPVRVKHPIIMVPTGCCSTSYFLNMNSFATPVLAAFAFVPWNKNRETLSNISLLRAFYSAAKMQLIIKSTIFLMSFKAFFLFQNRNEKRDFSVLKLISSKHDALHWNIYFHSYFQLVCFILSIKLYNSSKLPSSILSEICCLFFMICRYGLLRFADTVINQFTKNKVVPLNWH